MNNDDLFSPLFRWARSNRQGENFTTDAFAALLREMIKRDAALGSRFLGWLCFGSEKCCFFDQTTVIGRKWRWPANRAPWVGTLVTHTLV